MHILLIHQAFAALNEAGGTRHHEMARCLAEAGHRVTIIASPVSYLTGISDVDARPREASGAGGRITIIRAYTYSALHRSFFHRVISFFSFMVSSFFTGLKVRDVDVVWGTSPPIFQSVTAWLLARLKRAPFLLEVRDLWPAFAIEVGVLRNRLLIRASEWLERFLYKRADVVVVNSPGFIDHVQARGASHIELVPNGADPRMFDPHGHGTQFRDTYNLKGRFVVMYAGAHGMSNDLGVVLEAASQLQDRTEIALVLMGDGKEKPALQELSAEMNLTNLQFIPPQAKAQMSDALEASDACLAILKSVPLYATVYPNKVFDYMAAGRPVLLAINGVIRKVVERAEAGVYVPPGDAQALAEAIRQLADDPERGREMGINGRHLVEEKFDRVQQADKLALVIDTLVRPSGPPDDLDELPARRE